MKFLHQKSKFSLMPRRLAFNIGVPLVAAQNQAGYIKNVISPIPGSYTGLDPANGATGKGVLAAPYSVANQYLIIKGATASPFFTADLYDSNAKTITALTISGALAETLADAAVDLAQCSLIWLPTRAAWYLKSGSVSKVYPLTLSGTTLTVNAAIDISATFATTGNVLMTGDTTNTLYFFDNVAGLMKKCSVTALSTIGAFSALTAPAAGYSATTLIAAEMNFIYSNGSIYFAAPAATQKPVATFQAYSVVGNSWATKTWPAWLRSYPAVNCAIAADPSNNTNLWIMAAPTVYTDTPNMDSFVTQWTSATDVSEVYCYGNCQLRGLLPGNTAPVANSCTEAFYIQFSLKATFASVANGDLGIVSCKQTALVFGIYNFGTKFSRYTLLNYSGSGFFLGVSAGVAYASSTYLNGQFLNAALNVILTIDGGTERWLHIGGLDPLSTIKMWNLAFSTSLKIEIVGGNQGPYATVFTRPTVTAAVNILT